MTKVALITGSAVRVGREIAIHLAQKGWNLALHYRTSSTAMADLEAELKSRYPDLRFSTFQADFSLSEQTGALMKRVLETFGHLDLLVNNASVFEPSTFRETSVEMLNSNHLINYVAPFILMHDFVNASSGGQIINMVDTMITNNKSNYLAYTLSKKSLWEMTKMAALELAPNFRINAIAPGALIAPVGKDQQYLERVASKTPMKIPSGLIPVLKSIDFILDNDDLTGQLIFCDGGSQLM